MHPDSLSTLHRALSAYLQGMEISLKLRAGVGVALRELHLPTEEADLIVEDRRADFVHSLVRRSTYPIRVPLRDFSAAGIRDVIARTYPDDAAELLDDPPLPSKMGAKKGRG